MSGSHNLELVGKEIIMVWSKLDWRWALWLVGLRRNGIQLEEQQHKVSRSLSLALTSLHSLALEIVMYGLVSYFAEKQQKQQENLHWPLPPPPTCSGAHYLSLLVLGLDHFYSNVRLTLLMVTAQRYCEALLLSPSSVLLPSWFCQFPSMYRTCYKFSQVKNRILKSYIPFYL